MAPSMNCLNVCLIQHLVVIAVKAQSLPELAGLLSLACLHAQVKGLYPAG